MLIVICYRRIGHDAGMTSVAHHGPLAKVLICEPLT